MKILKKFPKGQIWELVVGTKRLYQNFALEKLL